MDPVSVDELLQEALRHHKRKEYLSAAEKYGAAFNITGSVDSRLKKAICNAKSNLHDKISEVMDDCISILSCQNEASKVEDSYVLFKKMVARLRVAGDVTDQPNQNQYYSLIVVKEAKLFKLLEIAAFPLQIDNLRVMVETSVYEHLMHFYISRNVTPPVCCLCLREFDERIVCADSHVMPNKVLEYCWGKGAELLDTQRQTTYHSGAATMRLFCRSASKASGVNDTCEQSRLSNRGENNFPMLMQFIESLRDFASSPPSLTEVESATFVTTNLFYFVASLGFRMLLTDVVNAKSWLNCNWPAKYSTFFLHCRSILMAPDVPTAETSFRLTMFFSKESLSADPSIEIPLLHNVHYDNVNDCFSIVVGFKGLYVVSGPVAWDNGLRLDSSQVSVSQDAVCNSVLPRELKYLKEQHIMFLQIQAASVSELLKSKSRQLGMDKEANPDKTGEMLPIVLKVPKGFIYRPDYSFIVPKEYESLAHHVTKSSRVHVVMQKHQKKILFVVWWVEIQLFAFCVAVDSVNSAPEMQKSWNERLRNFAIVIRDRVRSASIAEWDTFVLDIKPVGWAFEDCATIFDDAPGGLPICNFISLQLMDGICDYAPLC